MLPKVYTEQSSDSQLIAGCQQQNRLAQKYLYQRYYGQLLGVCMRYTAHRDEAEDVLNRAFLKIFQKIEAYEETGALKGWMATITLRTAIDYVRSKVKYRQIMDFDSEQDVTFEAQAVENLYAEDLYRLIQQLPPTSRTVFSLNVIEGYTHREISEMLDININTSKWHLAAAKKQLRKWIAAEEKPVQERPLKLAFLSRLF
ncbi:MAG: RNA polymerase sigma factor [Bacteroidota bacterium]